MQEPRPELIGTTGLWSARLYFDAPRDVAELQNAVTEYVTESDISVVGYYSDNLPSLTLLRWPENREGYTTPSPGECDVAVGGLRAKLRAKSLGRNVVPPRALHTMMGRKRGGYDNGEVAPLSQLKRSGLTHFTVTEGYMISARTVEGADVEPYGEPVGILLTTLTHEAEIHQIGHDLEQWHYAIERGPDFVGGRGRTDFYETPWARSSESQIAS